MKQLKHKIKKVQRAQQILARCREADVIPPAWVRHLLQIGDKGLRKKRAA